MTKITILDYKSQDGKKPIQFIRQCDTDEFEKAQYKPEQYTNIELIAKDFCPHEENNDVY